MCIKGMHHTRVVLSKIFSYKEVLYAVDLAVVGNIGCTQMSNILWMCQVLKKMVLNSIYIPSLAKEIHECTLSKNIFFKSRGNKNLLLRKIFFNLYSYTT